MDKTFADLLDEYLMAKTISDSNNAVLRTIGAIFTRNTPSYDQARKALNDYFERRMG